MGIFDASQSSGGSVNSASNTSSSISDSWANTAGAQASLQSEQAARVAFERQKELLQMQMNYNREEAQKARDWETNMANTIYTRSVNNMREAGINPILAASMGLSGASVGSGATASIGGATAPMANTYSEYNSASHSQSYGVGESEGRSWNQSTSGFTTAIEQIAGMFANIGNALSSGINVNFNATAETMKNTIEDTLGIDTHSTANGTGEDINGGHRPSVGQVIGNALSNAASAAINAFKYGNYSNGNVGRDRYSN